MQGRWCWCGGSSRRSLNYESCLSPVVWQRVSVTCALERYLSVSLIWCDAPNFLLSLLLGLLVDNLRM